MNHDELIEKTAAYVKTKFSGENTGHDWWHMYRVWQLAKTIAAGESPTNRVVLELGALLHDIADWKFHDGNEEAGPKAARSWLESLKVDEALIVHIEDIIRTVSFKGAGVPSAMQSLEGQIIHDADKLDAIGAIGIARTFAYGGANSRAIHNPDEQPQDHRSFESYKRNNGPIINHFYEKLLLLKDRMYTAEAKRLARRRHDYMLAFLEEFYGEWEGQK